MSERTFVAMPYPGIFRITLPLPFPGLNHVHTYLLDGPGGGLVLVDTGLGGGASWSRIVQGVRWLGRELTDIERIVLTHAHPDHIGMSKALQDASGAPVVCHPIAQRMFEAMQDPSGWEHLMGMLAEHGREPEDVSGQFFAIPMPERFEHVEEGDEIVMGGGAWEVWWTPGHEWGHVVFFRRRDSVLITGDTILGKITPHIGYHEEPADPLGQFLDSLDKVAALDAALVIPGHGRSFENATERVLATKAHHDFRLRRVRESLLRRGPVAAIEVSRDVFGRNLMFFHERLALSETLAHLEYLRLRGRVRREMVDGVWRYELPQLVP